MPDATTDLAPEDFYYEGPYLVFTAAYLLKRGYCCNSGCRHFPYGEMEQSAPREADDAAEAVSERPTFAPDRETP